MNFGKYPFDEQECKVVVSTYSMSNQELTLNPGPYGLLDMRDIASKQIGEFETKTVTKTSTVVDDAYTSLVGEVRFRREPSPYYFSTFLPDLLLHMCIWASFWIDCTAAPARVTLCIISALAFRIIMSSLYASLPPVTYSVWIVDFMVASQIMAVLSLLEYALVQFYLAKEKHHRPILSEMGRSARSVVTDGLDKGAFTELELFALVKKRMDLFEKGSVAALRATPSGPTTTAAPPPPPALGTSMDDVSVDVKAAKIALRKAEANRGSTSRHAVSLDVMENDAPELSDQQVGGLVAGGGGLHPVVSTSGRVEALVGVQDLENVSFLLDVFRSFDSNHDRSVSVVELRLGFRRFGRFYSNRQTCAMVEAFRRAYGSSLLEKPLLSTGDVVRLVILHGSGEFVPLHDFGAPTLTRPPTMVVDIIARTLYPLLFLAKCIYFAMALSQY